MSFHSIHHTCQNINLLSRSLINRPAFQDVNVVLPAANSESELAFIRATSWLYCLYFEAGKCSIKFLLQLADSYQLDTDKYRTHIESIRCLRTEFHHNLGFSDSDYNSRSTVETWYLRACLTRRPATPEHWANCYKSLTDEELDNSSPTFLLFLEDVMRRLESDSELEDGLDEWKRRLKNDFPAANFDPIIEDIKVRLACPALDTVKFRNRFVSRWKKELEKLDDDYDFDYESTLLIERDLLSDSAGKLPLSGKQIIEYLKISPGPEVGKYLQQAKNLYESGTHDATELLKEIEASISR